MSHSRWAKPHSVLNMGGSTLLAIWPCTNDATPPKRHRVFSRSWSGPACRRSTTCPAGGASRYHLSSEHDGHDEKCEGGDQQPYDHG